MDNLNVSKVTNFKDFLWNANAFSHDLSVWCVAHIPDQPAGFEGNATTPAHIPVWGTCPRGEIAQP